MKVCGVIYRENLRGRSRYGGLDTGVSACTPGAVFEPRSAEVFVALQAGPQPAGCIDVASRVTVEEQIEETVIRDAHAQALLFCVTRIVSPGFGTVRSETDGLLEALLLARQT